jgi:hypothetical protein
MYTSIHVYVATCRLPISRHVYVIILILIRDRVETSPTVATVHGSWMDGRVHTQALRTVVTVVPTMPSVTAQWAGPSKFNQLIKSSRAPRPGLAPQVPFIMQPAHLSCRFLSCGFASSCRDFLSSKKNLVHVKKNNIVGFSLFLQTVYISIAWRPITTSATTHCPNDIKDTPNQSRKNN